MLIFWVVREVKGQKMVQNDKKLFSFMLHISGAIHDTFLIMIRVCKMIISPGDFFIFSKFCFFGLLVGVKGKKWSKMTNKFCQLRSIPRESYMILLSLFIVHLCKAIMAPVFFFIQNFDFVDC